MKETNRKTNIKSLLKLGLASMICTTMNMAHTAHAQTNNTNPIDEENRIVPENTQSNAMDFDNPASSNSTRSEVELLHLRKPSNVDVERFGTENALEPKAKQKRREPIIVGGASNTISGLLPPPGDPIAENSAKEADKNQKARTEDIKAKKRDIQRALTGDETARRKLKKQEAAREQAEKERQAGGLIPYTGPAAQPTAEEKAKQAEAAEAARLKKQRNARELTIYTGEPTEADAAASSALEKEVREKRRRALDAKREERSIRQVQEREKAAEAELRKEEVKKLYNSDRMKREAGEAVEAGKRIEKEAVEAARLEKQRNARELTIYTGEPTEADAAASSALEKEVREKRKRALDAKREERSIRQVQEREKAAEAELRREEVKKLYNSDRMKREAGEAIEAGKKIEKEDKETSQLAARKKQANNNTTQAPTASGESAPTTSTTVTPEGWDVGFSRSVLEPAQGARQGGKVAVVEEPTSTKAPTTAKTPTTPTPAPIWERFLSSLTPSEPTSKGPTTSTPAPAPTTSTQAPTTNTTTIGTPEVSTQSAPMPQEPSTSPSTAQGITTSNTTAATSTNPSTASGLTVVPSPATQTPTSATSNTQRDVAQPRENGVSAPHIGVSGFFSSVKDLASSVKDLASSVVGAASSYVQDKLPESVVQAVKSLADTAFNAITNSKSPTPTGKGTPTPAPIPERQKKVMKEAIKEKRIELGKKIHALTEKKSTKQGAANQEKNRRAREVQELAAKRVQPQQHTPKTFADRVKEAFGTKKAEPKDKPESKATSRSGIRRKVTKDKAQAEAAE
jgi:hypothetical protein